MSGLHEGGIPDLGALRAAPRPEPMASEVFYVNHVSMSVAADGQVVLILSYQTPEGIVEMREVVMPAATYVTRILDVAPKVLEAVMQNLTAYTAGMIQRMGMVPEEGAPVDATVAPEAGEETLTPEQLADRRRAASQDGAGG